MSVIKNFSSNKHIGKGIVWIEWLNAIKQTKHRSTFITLKPNGIEII